MVVQANSFLLSLLLLLRHGLSVRARKVCRLFQRKTQNRTQKRNVGSLISLFLSSLLFLLARQNPRHKHTQGKGHPLSFTLALVSGLSSGARLSRSLSPALSLSPAFSLFLSFSLSLFLSLSLLLHIFFIPRASQRERERKREREREREKGEDGIDFSSSSSSFMCCFLH